MKGVIVYKSKYGSTKQYAEWLHEETDFELYNSAEFAEDPGDYDIVVVASSIHAGSLSLKSFLIDHWPRISEKIVAVLVTSGAGHHEVVERVVTNGLPPEMCERIHFFPVGGRYVLGRMSFIDRSIIRIVARFTKSPDARKGMLTEREDMDRTNLQNIMRFIDSQEL